VSEAQPAPRRAAHSAEARSEAARAADHGAIDHLADELVPALIAKLGTTNLGEIEVREGDWRVRLRRPAGSGVSYGRRATDRASRAQPGHEGHGHAKAAPEGHRPPRGGGAASTDSNGANAPILSPVGPGRPGGPGPGSEPDERSFATSPAVGVFQPAATLSAGHRVRAGDRLGVVDMLGVPHEVLAPADGVVGSTLVEAGHAVEYGQELVRIELTERPDAAGSGA